MKSVKTMLLGIAVLIIASMGVPLWMAGSAIGVIVLFAGLIIGLPLCLCGYFANDR